MSSTAGSLDASVTDRQTQRAIAAELAQRGFAPERIALEMHVSLAEARRLLRPLLRLPRRG